MIINTNIITSIKKDCNYCTRHIQFVKIHLENVKIFVKYSFIYLIFIFPNPFL